MHACACARVCACAHTCILSHGHAHVLTRTACAQVSLDSYVPATLAGLAPTEFVLRAELNNGTAVPGTTIRSRDNGGTGYVCCGATISFALLDVPRTHAPAIQVNLTSGAVCTHARAHGPRGTHGHRVHAHVTCAWCDAQVRTAFIKHDECADPAFDIEGAGCSAPSCELTWLTEYDEFYGNMIHTYAQQLALPFGPTPWNYDPLVTKRRDGDWYVSVTALPGLAAHFELTTALLEPPRPPKLFQCSRFAGFCPKAHYHPGLGLSSEELQEMLHDIAHGTSGASHGCRPTQVMMTCCLPGCQ